MQTFVIGRRESGHTLADVLRTRLPLPWAVVRRLVRDRRVRISGVPCLNLARRVRAGQRVEVQDTESSRPPPKPSRSASQCRTQQPAGPAPVIRFADADVVVVDKPAGLTTMRHRHEESAFGPRGRRFLPPTLADLLPGLLATDLARPPKLRAVHRLDKETSGLVVFARTVAAERHLGLQFRAHTTDRRYVAVVRGRARPGRIESRLVEDRGDGRRGSTAQSGLGKPAVTHVRVLEELGDFTLIECNLETGRTHQVRIHLGESGTPLCGERLYDRPVHGQPLPDASGAPRLALHAARLGFIHPATGQRMAWEVPLPKDLAGLVTRLRKQARAHSQRAPGEQRG
jgi:23S rRNA pseudouridine1911/1915/1917 synthase